MDKKPLPTKCKYCSEGSDPNHWSWHKRKLPLLGCWEAKCILKNSRKRYETKRNSNPTKVQEWRQYHKLYHENNACIIRYNAYVSLDKKKGHESDLDKRWAIPMMISPCFYCEKPEAGGLDRTDSALGHHSSNVVACCEMCNYLLCDLPFVAKLALKPGLKEIRNNNLAPGYVPPPKRNTKKAQRRTKKEMENKLL